MSGEIRNLFTDPRPVGKGTWTMNNGTTAGAVPTMSLTGTQLLIEGYETTGNAYAMRTMSEVPAGEYVFSCKAQSASYPTFFGERIVCVTNGNWNILGTVPDSALNKERAILRFANPVQQGLRFLFQSPNKAAKVTYERILLCTADDYERMLDIGGISDPYFYGESLPYA